MDKTSSVLAALEAGKYPSTQQFTDFITWVDNSILSQNNLSSQGRLLSNRVRQLLAAYKQLAVNKDGDNVLQDGLWHLSCGDITGTAEAGEPIIDKDEATKDLKELQNALQTLISITWRSLTSESGTLVEEFASFLRLSLADAAELIESGAGSAKQNLREIEQGVQSGDRTTITGRDKQRVEEESGDAKVMWEHGMDAVKEVGSEAIEAGRTVTAKIEDTSERTTDRLRSAYEKFWVRAQDDPNYRSAVEGLLAVLQKRIHKALDASSSDSLSSLFEDPTPEKHVANALDNFQTFLERMLSGQSLNPFIHQLRACLDAIAQDKDLRVWFDDFIDYSRRSLEQKGFANSEEAKKKRKELRGRWQGLKDKEDSKWNRHIEALKSEAEKLHRGFEKDQDLEKVKQAHIQLGKDIEAGLVEAGEKAETTVEALVERATWFWQDIFRVYIPQFVSFVSSLPIPRTEYKDSEIEFVLENLDVSSLNLLPSHVYIRNITDVDIQTSSSATGPTRTAVGTLTRIKLDAVQLNLKDVSFWYKDLNASALTPSEFSGLVTLTLPPQGISLDLKVRLIPNSIPRSDPRSRESLKHYHIVEHVEVSISEDINMTVKDSNHGVLLAMFKPIYMMRLRQALEKTLAAQTRAFIEWMDGVAYDIGIRKEVIEDTGVVSGGAAVLAAVWSEIGRMRREGSSRAGAIDIKATGTGVVVEQQREGIFEGGRPVTTEAKLAVGAEPQILSGDKHGPLATASEPLGNKVQHVVEQASGMDVDEVAGRVGRTGVDSMTQLEEGAERIQQQVKGAVREGKKQVQGFRRTVNEKAEQEKKNEGWRSDAFDVKA